MALPDFRAASPSEEDLVFGQLGNLDDFLGGEVVASPAHVFVDDQAE